MFRGMLFVGFVAGAFAAGLYWTKQDPGAALTLPRPAVPQKQQSCADDCEQAALAQQTPEAELRACRARCGDPGAVMRPHEVPRSITVAPVDHRGGLMPPPDRRITRTH